MYKAKYDFLIGIDSDGCAFDTMELKQKECFTPNTIRFWGLQGVSKYAREATEFVNLYSKSRGINRFPALVESLDWLARRPETQTRGVRSGGHARVRGLVPGLAGRAHHRRGQPADVELGLGRAAIPRPA